MNSNRDVQYFTSPNSSTKIIQERSVSPTSGRRTFKTAKYTEYSNSINGNGGGTDSGYNTVGKVNVESSINQLDSLLNELKVERDLATEPSMFLFKIIFAFSPEHFVKQYYGHQSKRKLLKKQSGRHFSHSEGLGVRQTIREQN